MKKSSLILGSLLVALSLSACNNGVDKLPEPLEVDESNNIVSSELPEVQEIETETEEVNECKFTKESADKVREYLEGYNYINVIQSVENGLKNETSYTSIVYNVVSDTTTKVTDFNIITSYGDNDERGSGEKHYIRDFANDITYERNDDDTEWLECDGKIPMIDWDILSFDNSYAIWKYLMKDCDTPVDTIGYISGDYEYYTVVKEADDSFISGIEYDRLGDQEMTYIYHRIGDSLIPTSVVVEINYFVGNTEYYVRSTVQLATVGNTSLNIPELGVD